jgi:diamine N-acetyltransferase
MPRLQGNLPLSYHQIGRDDFCNIFGLAFDPVQVDRYLDPIEDIVAAVAEGAAHAMFGIETDEGLIGFYVVHPDRRDNACWWLGWFALDCRQQGRGYGRSAMKHIMASLCRIAVCRRVRLVVSSDNTHAMRLYVQAGFRIIGARSIGELILEATLPETFPVSVACAALVRLPAKPGHVGRLRSSAGPHAARMIGVERGPPGPSADFTRVPGNQLFGRRRGAIAQRRAAASSRRRSRQRGMR